MESRHDLDRRGYWGGVWFYRVLAVTTWPLISFPAALFGLRYGVLAALGLLAYSFFTSWWLRRHDLPLQQLKIANLMLAVASGSVVIVGALTLIRLGWYYQ